MRHPANQKCPSLIWTSVLVFAMYLASCGNSDITGQPATEDASFGRRVFRPPPKGQVRAVPPHNIHSAGVGPYKLMDRFQTAMALLPDGPRVELFKISGLFDYRLMRAEHETLVLGVGRKGHVEFISVLDPDIARTESGVGVGAGIQDVLVALGGVQLSTNSGRDSRLITFSSLPKTRFIVEQGKVVAAIVLENQSSQSKVDSAEETCPLTSLRSRAKEILAEAGMETSTHLINLNVGCLAKNRSTAVVQSGDRMAIVELSLEGSLKLRAKGQIPGLSFAAILNTGDGPELYSVSKIYNPLRREVLVNRHRITSERITTPWSKVAVVLEAKPASWIGAKIQDADFLIEARGTKGAIRIGGLYMQRKQGQLRHIVPIEPIDLPVGRKTKSGASAKK